MPTLSHCQTADADVEILVSNVPDLVLQPLSSGLVKTIPMDLSHADAHLAQDGSQARFIIKEEHLTPDTTGEQYRAAFKGFYCNGTRGGALKFSTTPLLEVTGGFVLASITGDVINSGQLNGISIQAFLGEGQTVDANIGDNALVAVSGDKSNLTLSTAVAIHTARKLAYGYRASSGWAMRLSRYLLMFCLFCLSACQFPIPALVFVGGEETGFVDGLLTSARFNAIIGMVIDSEGNVFMIDGGNIRKITPSGEVSTIASSRQWLEEAGLHHPRDRIAGFTHLGIDSKDNLFITHTTCIRKLEKQGEEYIASTFVGTCYDQRSNVEVGIENPYEYEHYNAELTSPPESNMGMIVIDTQDHIYVSNGVLLSITPNKQVSVLKTPEDKPLLMRVFKLISGQDRKIYGFMPANETGLSSSAVFILDTFQNEFKQVNFSEAVHNNVFSFAVNKHNHLYLLTKTGRIPYTLMENLFDSVFRGLFQKNNPVLQRISPDGKEVKTWPLPEGVSLENAVLDEKRRVIYTGSRRGNQIFKIPLPDGA